MDGPSTGAQRYELCERIAVGGMAEVFRAKAFGPHGFSKVLAIKRILPALAADPKFERRFIAEAKLAVALSHANIVQVLDFSRFGQSLYIVMEFVDGGDLADVLVRGRELGAAMPVEAAMHVAIDLLRGLEFAHGRGVVHRDVSPSNVLLSRSGEVKIADFGIARAAGLELSRTFRIMGKWRYMSPEQTRGEELKASSDVFSAAAVLFEVFTGRRLFAGDDPEDIVRAIRNPARPAMSSVRRDLPAELDAPIEAALALAPGDRITTSELLQGINDICYARSLPIMPLGLASYLASILPSAEARAGAANGAGKILDQILESEQRPRDRTRITAQALGPPAMHPDDIDQTGTGMTFIRAMPDEGGMSRWSLEDTTGTGAAVDEASVADADPTTIMEAAAPARSGGRGDHTAVDDTPVPATFDSPMPEAVDDTPTPAIDLRSTIQSVSPPAPRAAGQGGSLTDTVRDTPARQRSLVATVPAAAGLAPRRGLQPPAVASSIASALASRSPAPSAPPSSLAAVTARPASSSAALASPAPSSGAALGGRSSRRRIAGLVAVAVAVATLVVGWAVLHGRGDGTSRASGDDRGGDSAAQPLGPQPASPSSGATPALAHDAGVIDGHALAADDRDAGVMAFEPDLLPAIDAGATGRHRDDRHDEQRRHDRGKPADRSAGKSPVHDHPASDDHGGDRASATGTIDLFSEPWADVYLDGKKIATAPQRAIRLPVGRQRLTLVNPVQHRRRVITVTVPSDRPIKVSLPPAE